MTHVFHLSPPSTICARRYGDPLNPNADLEMMEALLKNHMCPGGLLLLAVPVGKDTLVFNAHRVYGCVLHCLSMSR